MSKNSRARLTPGQMERLMVAVLRKCRDAGVKLKVSPSYRIPGGGDRGSGDGGAGWGQFLWWWLKMGNFWEWIHSIPIEGGEHLA